MASITTTVSPAPAIYQTELDFFQQRLREYEENWRMRYQEYEKAEDVDWRHVRSEIFYFLSIMKKEFSDESFNNTLKWTNICLKNQSNEEQTIILTKIYNLVCQFLGRRNADNEERCDNTVLQLIKNILTKYLTKIQKELDTELNKIFSFSVRVYDVPRSGTLSECVNDVVKDVKEKINAGLPESLLPDLKNIIVAYFSDNVADIPVNNVSTKSS